MFLEVIRWRWNYLST